MKKLFIAAGFLCLLGLQLVNGQEKRDEKLWQEALRLHHQALVIDTHCDTPLLMRDGGIDIGRLNEKNSLDLIRMERGGVDAAFFAVYVSNRRDRGHPALDALEMIDAIYRQVEKYPLLAELAFSPEDIRRISAGGRRAILIGMENGGPLQGSLPMLRIFHRLGVRYITLTHNANNDICDSSTEEKPRWNGLSPFGRRVVAEMNRLGMLIDVSHLADKSIADILEISRVPVFASHSCVRSLCRSPRNLPDELIKAIARKGGVVQLNFFSGFLDEEFRLQMQAVEKRIFPAIQKLKSEFPGESAAYWEALGQLWRKEAPPPVGIGRLIDHVDYLVRLAGVDAVGLGSDYDGAGSYPPGLEDVSGFPLITYELLKRGYREAQIKKILGENFLRVFAAAIGQAG